MSLLARPPPVSIGRDSGRRSTALWFTTTRDIPAVGKLFAIVRLYARLPKGLSVCRHVVPKVLMRLWQLGVATNPSARSRRRLEERQLNRRRDHNRPAPPPSTPPLGANPHQRARAAAKFYRRARRNKNRDRLAAAADGSANGHRSPAFYAVCCYAAIVLSVFTYSVCHLARCFYTASRRNNSGDVGVDGAQPVP